MVELSSQITLPPKPYMESNVQLKEQIEPADDLIIEHEEASAEEVILPLDILAMKFAYIRRLLKML